MGDRLEPLGAMVGGGPDETRIHPRFELAGRREV
jgi:hypothetical protein